MKPPLLTSGPVARNAGTISLVTRPASSVSSSTIANQLASPRGGTTITTAAGGRRSGQETLAMRLVIAVIAPNAPQGRCPRGAGLAQTLHELDVQRATVMACLLARVADKLAKLEAARQRPRKRRLAHYRATLDGVEDRYGRSPLSERLREQLARW